MKRRPERGGWCHYNSRAISSHRNRASEIGKYAASLATADKCRKRERSWLRRGRRNPRLVGGPWTLSAARLQSTFGIIDIHTIQYNLQDDKESEQLPSLDPCTTRERSPGHRTPSSVLRTINQACTLIFARGTGHFLVPRGEKGAALA